MLIHTVAPGESLYDISYYYQIPMEEIIKINGLSEMGDLLTGQSLVIPVETIPYRPSINVNGYLYNLGESAVPIVKEDGKYLTILSPFSYLIDEYGDLKGIEDIPAINAAYEENIIPMMTINNFTVNERGENVAHIVLNNREVQEKLLANLLETMRSKGYQGINIDFENVYPFDRQAYNRFLELIVDRFHNEGYFVSTALAPKTSEAQKGLLYEAHDYEAHGRIADFVVLMTYEWGYRFGPPGAISPINEIQKVLDYAVTVIPREKIYFGFEIYARDWVIPYEAGVEAETFSSQEAIERAEKYGATIQYDTVAQAPYYRYTDENGIMHEVWFEDARSAQAKFDMVKDYQLGGISYWVLGYPFPQNWALLEDNFIIQKA